MLQAYATVKANAQRTAYGSGGLFARGNKTQEGLCALLCLCVGK